MKTPAIHIFDMDHTLIDADCDVSWKSYAVKAGLAPADAIQEADRFFEQYNAGKLDIGEFMLFQFREFIGRTPAEMAEHTKAHFESFIRDHCYPAALELVKSLRASGKPVAILTSTNTAIAGPVGAYFGIGSIMGTTLEVIDGRYTGRIVGEYAAGPGKIAPAAAFAASFGLTPAEVAYYGDSINDRNILEAVGFPFAVNPSAALAALALERNWPVIRF
jgi:HAD superfamily hydrolase (TIGR01490 family)